MSRHWILDGHNIIFALGGLQRLQRSGRGAEARALLVERLEAFANRRQERVLLVFDGRGVQSPPQSRRAGLFEEAYSHGAGGADRRILDEARRLVAQGTVITVVTNDMRTLANALPREARRLRVHDFWLEHIERPAAEEEKPVAAGAFPDLERAMLALEPEPARSRPAAAERRTARGPAGAGPEPPAFPALTGEALRHEKARLKRERGRVRQERLLKRGRKS
ncbi:MAG TPA: NYN domain-containing protein [Candidatus Polarisedimenticolia bacterium]|nr:NYN domain-containing protein [Candidatus Polarisedimenticolia bacterium]